MINQTRQKIFISLGKCGYGYRSCLIAEHWEHNSSLFSGDHVIQKSREARYSTCTCHELCYHSTCGQRSVTYCSIIGINLSPHSDLAINSSGKEPFVSKSLGVSNVKCSRGRCWMGSLVIKSWEVKTMQCSDTVLYVGASVRWIFIMCAWLPVTAAYGHAAHKMHCLRSFQICASYL